MSNEREFRKLKEIALKEHTYTYCIKMKLAIPVSHLIPSKCMNCEEYILNKGTCDPL